MPGGFTGTDRDWFCESTTQSRRRPAFIPVPSTSARRVYGCSYKASATTRNPITEYAVSGAFAERYPGRV